jgi:hypothetical protein
MVDLPFNFNQRNIQKELTGVGLSNIPLVLPAVSRLIKSGIKKDQT